MWWKYLGGEGRATLFEYQTMKHDEYKSLHIIHWRYHKPFTKAGGSRKKANSNGAIVQMNTYRNWKNKMHKQTSESCVKGITNLVLDRYEIDKMTE